MQVSLNQLNDIFSEVLEQKVVLTKSTKREDLENWDSLHHLNLVVELEDRLNISFSTKEIEKIDSIQYLLDIIEIK